MSKVSYLIQFTIADGKSEEFESKARAYTAATEANEPDTLGYQWYRAEEGSICLLQETFASSEALLHHLGNVGPSLPELLAIAPITRFEVLGSVSAEARGALDTLGVKYFPLMVGFER